MAEIGDLEAVNRLEGYRNHEPQCSDNSTCQGKPTTASPPDAQVTDDASPSVEVVDYRKRETSGSFFKSHQIDCCVFSGDQRGWLFLSTHLLFFWYVQQPGASLLFTVQVGGEIPIVTLCPLNLRGYIWVELQFDLRF